MLTLGDLPGNAARYVQICDGFREDVRIIDLEMLTFDWYVPMLGHHARGVKFPGERPNPQGSVLPSLLSYISIQKGRYQYIERVVTTFS